VPLIDFWFELKNTSALRNATDAFIYISFFNLWYKLFPSLLIVEYFWSLGFVFQTLDETQRGAGGFGSTGANWNEHV
jgi:hypothetical protein